jgi:AmpD protein
VQGGRPATTGGGARLMAEGGWLRQARRVPSPNWDARPAGTVVDLLVIHGISLPPGEFGGPWIDDLFLNRLDPTAHPYFPAIAGLRVSCHLLIRRDGELLQYVDLRRRAWHAGVSSFEGRGCCNDYAVGIELEGADDTPYEDAQYHRLAEVTKEVTARFPAITPQRIAGHSDIAPGRKTDPGPAFDWPRFRQLLEGRGTPAP